MRFFTYGAAGALLTVDKEAVATLRLRGPVTPQVLVRAAADLADYMQRRSVQAVVNRLEGAHLVCGIERTLIAAPRLPEVLRRVPVAIVVARADLDDAEAYARRQREAGLIRRVFEDYLEAVQWARQKGRALSPFPPELPYFRETL